MGADGGLAAIGTVNKVIQLLFFVMGFRLQPSRILGFNYGAQSYLPRAQGPVDHRYLGHDC